MKYNEKYDRYVTTGGLVYRYDSKQDKLVLCKLSNSHGYLIARILKPKRAIIGSHRIVWETFNGEIPTGYEIDHINTIRDDNRLCNLRLVTRKENMHNPLTEQHRNKALLGRSWSEFGKKFKEHFGLSKYEDIELYQVEHHWYRTHNNTCRWEKEA